MDRLYTHRYALHDGRIWHSIDGGDERDITMEWFGFICESIMAGAASGIRKDVSVHRLFTPMRRKIRRYVQGHHNR